MQKMIPALTERQRYWLDHSQACEASGKSMVKYVGAAALPGQDSVALALTNGLKRGKIDSGCSFIQSAKVGIEQKEVVTLISSCTWPGVCIPPHREGESTSGKVRAFVHSLLKDRGQDAIPTRR